MKSPNDMNKSIQILQAQLNACQEALAAEKDINIALAEKVAFLDNIISVLPGHVYWKNRDHVYLGCNNNQAENAALASRDEVVGKTLYDLIPVRQEVEKINAIDTLVMDDDKPYIMEELVTMACGTATYLSHKVPLHDSLGNVTGMLGVSFDISKRKQVEQELRESKRRLEIAEQDKKHVLASIIKEITGQAVAKERSISDLISYIRRHYERVIALMPGYIYWKDPKGVYLGCNDQIVAIAGVESREEVIGLTDYDLPWCDKADALVEHDREVMQSGLTQAFEETALAANGEVIYTYTNKTPLRNQKGEMFGVLGISIDVTELKKAEAKAREAQAQAEIANRMKTEFIRNMQHDIRTPLSGVWGMAHILNKKATDPKQKDDLNDLEKCAKELLDYCNRILDFSNIELQSLPFGAEQFSIEQLGRKIISLEKPAANNKGLELYLDCDESLPHIVVGDYFRTYTILVNLISNAIKFTDSGYVRLILRNAVVSQDSAEVSLQLVVEDSGIGIPKEKQDIIFEKFSKLSSSNEGHYRGLGLGLSFVKTFIKDLKGTVEIESRLDGGTAFICTISFILPSDDEMMEVSEGKDNEPIKHIVS